MTLAVHATHTFERRYAGPAARVFAAWEDPAARSVWAAPDSSVTVTYTEAAFKVGGSDVAECTMPGEPPFTVRGHYIDIVRDQRIVFSESISMDGALLGTSLVTAEFWEEAGEIGMRVTVQTVGLDGSGLEQEVAGGWSGALDQLDAFLARAAA